MIGQDDIAELIYRGLWIKWEKTEIILLFARDQLFRRL